MGALPAAAGAAGAASTVAGLFGTVLQAGGAYEAGNAQSQMYGYQAQVAANNATIERSNAAQTLAAGNVQESDQKLKTGEIVGSQRAAQASNGLDVNFGSNVDVRNSTQSVGDLDAAMIHYNAARTAYGQKLTANNFQDQAELDTQAAKNSKQAGALKALTTLIGGASSTASKYNQFKLAGVN